MDNKMNKKTIYILISIILFVVLLFLAYVYLKKDDGGKTGGTPSIFRNFFPFGGNNPELTGNEFSTTTNNEQTPTETPIDFTSKLRKISIEPVAGAGLLDVKAGTVVRYIEKATGHIFETELFSPRSGRISNTTIPQVYRAFWGNKNNSLLTQYLKEDDTTIDTVSLTIKDVSTTTENTITGTPFGNGINDISVFGNSVFYLEQKQISSNGYISDFNGNNKKLIWNSPIKEVNSQYVNARTIALTTKPEEGTDGFLYFIDAVNGSQRKILGNVKGLSALVSGDALKVLYVKQDGGFDMIYYNLNNKSEEYITPETLPEKCVWSTKDINVVYCAVPKNLLVGGNLTAWYKGLIQYNDDIWKYNLENNSATMIGGLEKESGEKIDVINPILSENEQYLVFINKIDNSLWSLDVSK